MTDHIGEATQKVIDLDALEKLADGVIGGWSKSRTIYEPEAAAIKALTAELKEARALLERTRPYTSTLAVGAADLHSDIRAFLARNGKGEG